MRRRYRELTIGPAAPFCTSTLTATADLSSDDDTGDTVSFKYQWALVPEGPPGAGKRASRGSGLSWGHDSTDGVLTGVTLHRGEKWAARACATDGTTDSAWTSQVEVTIGNSPPPDPAAATIAATPSPATAISELRATATSGGDDPDGDTVTYKYQWALVPTGFAAGTIARSPGLDWGHDSTDGVLRGVALHKGEVWLVGACATDGTLDSGWTAAVQVTIRNAPPTLPPTVAITPAVPGVEDLTGVAGESDDADDDDLTYEYQWAKVNPAGGYLTAWANNPGLVLPASTVSFGETWRVRARAFDGTDYSPWKPGKTAKIVRMVTYTTPAADATGVPADSLIQLTFKWPVDQLSVNRRLRVFCGASLVAGSARWIVPNLKVRFVPKAPLRSDTSYQIRLASGITCTSGRVLGWGENYWFKTAPATTTAAVTVAAAPTARSTQFTVNLTSAATIRTVITNIAGRAVAELPERDLPAGVSSLLWNGRSNSGSKVPSGTYLIHVAAIGNEGEQTTAIAPLQVR